MIFYIFLVAAFNLGLGFGAAVYLGRRCPTAVGAADPWDADAGFGSSSDHTWVDDEDLAAGIGLSAVDLSEFTSIGADTTDPIEESPTPAGPAFDDAQTADAPASPRPPRSHALESVDDLHAEVQQFNEQVVEADDLLRSCAEDPQADEIRAILGSLADSTRQYLDHRETEGTLRSLSEESDAIHGEVRAAMDRQDEQIGRTSALIEGFDYERDLKMGCRRVVDQTCRLIESNDQLQETLDEVKVELAEGPRHPKSIVPRASSDRPDASSDRRGPTDLATDVEAELRKWWEDASGRAPGLSVALVELDPEAETGRRHAQAVVDAVVDAAAGSLPSELGGRTRLVLLPETRLLVLLPKADARAAANAAERLRQTVERLDLGPKGPDAGVTVTCAVADTSPGDTPRSLAQRAEATLREARRYGVNRTFLHDGRYPTPVVPPDFSPEKGVVSPQVPAHE